MRKNRLAALTLNRDEGQSVHALPDCAAAAARHEIEKRGNLQQRQVKDVTLKRHNKEGTWDALEAGRVAAAVEDVWGMLVADPGDGWC